MPDGSNVIETLISTSKPGLTCLISVKPGETSAKLGTGGEVPFAMLPCQLAVGANADDAQHMLSNFKLMLGGHGILKRFELSRKELDDLAALRTDHVIVMLMFVVVFVVRASVAEANLPRQAGFSQQF